MKQWIKIPTKWVIDTDKAILKKMKWVGINKAHNTAALMVYIAIAHSINDIPARGRENIGEAILSYTELVDITSLSRALVVGAINVLINENLITKSTSGKVNRYAIVGYEEMYGWGKLPAKKLYGSGLEKITAFKNFHLRKKVELDAMKIYFLALALRNNQTNYAQMTYEKITEYTGIHRNDISSATSFLVASELIRINQIESKNNENQFINIYRLVGLDSYNHVGTKGKKDPEILVSTDL
jgi:hypothetical protein